MFVDVYVSNLGIVPWERWRDEAPIQRMHPRQRAGGVVIAHTETARTPFYTDRDMELDRVRRLLRAVLEYDTSTGDLSDIASDFFVTFGGLIVECKRNAIRYLMEGKASIGGVWSRSKEHWQVLVEGNLAYGSFQMPSSQFKALVKLLAVMGLIGEFNADRIQTKPDLDGGRRYYGLDMNRLRVEVDNAILRYRTYWEV